MINVFMYQGDIFIFFFFRLILKILVFLGVYKINYLFYFAFFSLNPKSLENFFFIKLFLFLFFFSFHFFIMIDSKRILNKPLYSAFGVCY